ncbi:type I restriction endonuclease subunit R, EcoR124 family [Enterococcus faecium]|uniref:type I restriction endonuclease subunit R, EcoR124 family n=1 Tax=Enterococcus faecium TaxID=1352 RepID=UPI0031381CED
MILLKAEIDDGNDPEVEIDIEYELESIKTEEINYEYILMLIQAFVPSGNTEYELFAKEDKKATEEIDRYLNDLEKTNPQIARLMRSLWKDILIDPENYRDKNVSHLLEEMIQAKQYAAIKDFSDKWHVEEEELAYVVANYNVKKEKQSGESELKQSADYEGYKASTEKPLSKLKYWKTVRNDFENVMKNQILPLQRR